MAYQYPPQPQQPQYPQQPPPPPAPQAPPPLAPQGPTQPSELSKLGFFGMLTFFAVAAMLAFALLGWILTLAKTIHGGNFYQFAGFFGQAGLVLLGITIVLRLLDREKK